MNPFGPQKSIFETAGNAIANIRNVFCVGRNYTEHAQELGNAVPEQPMLFGKWSHSLAAAQGVVQLPKHRELIHHELEVVLWIQETPKAGQPWLDAIGGVALGLDLTDRAAQNRLKAAGQPWEFAKAFRNSAIITDFHRVQDWDALLEEAFSMEINGRVVQTGRMRDMIFAVPTLLEYVRDEFGLAAADVLFTGTPAGVGAVRAGDHVRLRFGDDVWGVFEFR